ncbi:uncharacterized protein LOC126592575 isoform X2 [Malus sylvestris]|uniref:uncharacterized protein LOC126592575 isoform X2 n=1 Tax=Malus sylvestris TaxID=3752 RepID=UPI0021AD3343|nr:uncharacterized protein LOC126592575 isoform X2 [Malus sylvestris]
MEGEELRRSEADTVDLLNQFECILESDPQIDEVGFLHPSQFSKLNKEAGHSSPSSDDSTVLRSVDGNSVFWNRDHKLGISTQVLFPLYEALNSKSDVSGDEKSLYVSLSLDNSFESDVMKHSRALLLLSSDFGTAWHSRKLVVSQKHKLSAFLDKQHDYKDFVVDGIQTEPFNLINEEREEGYFNADGKYITYAIKNEVKVNMFIIFGNKHDYNSWVVNARVFIVQLGSWRLLMICYACRA